MTHSVPDFISVEELPQYSQNEDVVLLDVRDARSFAANHLPNVVHLLPDDLANDIDNMDTSKHYIIICYHGVMAVSVVNFMRGHGLIASVLKGGMAAV